MRHRVPERGRRLARQRAAGQVGDRARDHHRQVAAELVVGRLDAGIGRLGVQRVEDRLDDEDVGAALDEPLRGLGIGVAQLVEGNRTKAGIVDVRRDRRGAVGRAQRADDEAPLAVLRRRAIARGTRQPRAFSVQLGDDLLHAVIGLRDRRRREGVGGNEIGAGLGIGVVDVLDRLRLGEDEQIVVAANILLPIGEALAAELLLGEPVALDHRAHRAIQHEDLFAREIEESLADLRALLRQVCHQAAFCSRNTGRMPRRWQIA